MEGANPLPPGLRATLSRTGHRATSTVLVVSVVEQAMWRLDRQRPRLDSRPQVPRPLFRCSARWVVSTSRFGVGQVKDSNRTPLGLHRIARKLGGGLPVGSVFKGRQPVGLLWKGMPEGGICHRILWLEGLEPGFNQGGGVDTFQRYIYIHGFNDEATLGRPASRGCVHMASGDLIKLYDSVSEGTLVWVI